MPHRTDLLDALRLAGLTVTEVDGWRTRGSSSFNPGGSVHHHTAGPRRGVQPSLGICTNGRPDLPGPLCNVHGPREESLRVNLVAAGRANHAGRGGWRGLTGNSSVFGLEEEHIGTPSEPISDLRIDRMARVHAAFAYLSGVSAEMVCQHYEWAGPRKVDFVAQLIQPASFRLRVGAHLALMRHGPKPPPKPTPGGFLMALTDEQQGTVLAGALASLQVQEEVVGTTDKDGDTRQDLVVDILNEIKRDVGDIKRRLDALES